MFGNAPEMVMFAALTITLPAAPKPYVADEIEAPPIRSNWPLAVTETLPAAPPRLAELLSA